MQGMISPLCCLMAIHVDYCNTEDNLFRIRQRQWSHTTAQSLGAKIFVQCEIASSPGSKFEQQQQQQHQLGSSPHFTCSIREARAEDAWHVADTHCATFMPNQGLLMDFALRLDRMMAVLGSLPLQHKKCLVAVEEAKQEEISTNDLLTLVYPISHVQVSGILTVDHVGEFLPRRKSGNRRTSVAYISNVAVRHERRRRGIAKKLLRASERFAISWGCRSIALHCDSNNPGAVSLYLSQGYKVIKVPVNAKWPQPKGLPGSKYLLMMKLLRNNR